MSLLSQKGLEKAIKKYLTTLEPIAKDVVKKSETTTAADGSMSVKQQRGDIYMDDQMASALAKSLAKAIAEHLNPLLGG